MTEHNQYVTLVNEEDSVVSEENEIYTARSVEISTQTINNENESSSIIGAIFILMNAVLGAGILEFPYLLSKVGLITAFIFLAFLILCAVSAHLILAKGTDETDTTSYHLLVGEICGTKLMLLAQVSLVLYCAGSNITYMVTIGDQLTDVCFYISNSTLDNHQYYCDRRFLIPVASFIFILPLIWFKNISAFGYVSFLSVASVFYLVLAVLVEFLQGRVKTDNDIWFPPATSNPISTLSILPAISFAYQCHMTTVPLYAEMKDKSVRKYSAIVLTSMFLVTVSYLIVGYAGLAMFGSDVQPDIILSFPNNSITMTIGRIAIFISVSMTYPIVAFIGRGAFEGFLMEITRSTRHPIQRDSETLRLSVTPVWFVVTVVTATFASGIKEVIGVVGSFASLFMFFFPGSMVVARSWRRRNYAHVFAGALLASLGVFIFSMNIVDIISEHVSKHLHNNLVSWWSFQVPGSLS